MATVATAAAGGGQPKISMATHICVAKPKCPMGTYKPALLMGSSEANIGCSHAGVSPFDPTQDVVTLINPNLVEFANGSNQADLILKQGEKKWLGAPKCDQGKIIEWIYGQGGVVTGGTCVTVCSTAGEDINPYCDPTTDQGSIAVKCPKCIKRPPVFRKNTRKEMEQTDPIMQLAKKVDLELGIEP